MAKVPRKSNKQLFSRKRARKVGEIDKKARKAKKDWVKAQAEANAKFLKDLGF